MRVPSAKRLMEAFRDLDKKNANLIRAFAHAVDDPDKLMELVERVPQTEKYVRQLYSSPYRSAMWRRTVALHAIDVLVEGFGVESIPDEDEDDDPRRGSRYEYINFGDTYATTLIYDSAKDNLFIGSWGDVVERRGNPDESKSDRPKSSLTLPKKIGESVTVTAHGKNLTIKKNSKDSFFMRIDGEQRARWGTRAEASEDVSYFLETSHLPRSTETSWNPSSVKTKRKGRIPINPTTTYENLLRGMIVQVPTVRETDSYSIEVSGEHNVIDAGTYVLMQDPDTDPDDVGDRDWEAHFVEYDPLTGELGQYWQSWDNAFREQRTPFKVLGRMDAAQIHSIMKKLEKRWAKAAAKNGDKAKNPVKRKMKEKQVTLPKRIGESVTVTAHGKNLTIKKNSKDSFFLRIDGEKRTRWGNMAEASEDVSYFLETGYLPRETGTSWNPSVKAAKDNPKTENPAAVRRRVLR